MLFSSNKPIEIINKFKNVNKIIKEYIFIDILTENDITNNENIYQNIKESKFLMINQYIDQKEYQKEDADAYIIIGFKKTIINIKKSIFSILQPLLSSNPDINICFLCKIDDINIDTTNKSQIIDNKEHNFQIEIDNFNKELFLSKACDEKISKTWRFIAPCISGYLIKESYEKTKINRLNNFINFEKLKETSSDNYSINTIPLINEDEFIELREIGSENGFKVLLIYHIEREELYAQKKQIHKDDEITKAIENEIENYLKIQHPLIPKFIGVGQNKEYFVIEFINGQTLTNINELNFSEKITIFLELMIIIEFLHRKGFIYRN